MSKLIPDYVFDSIYDITPEVLTAHGVRGVLVDLDIDRCTGAFRSLGMDAVADLINPYYPAEMIGRLEHGVISFHEACDEMRRLSGTPEVTDAQIAWAYGQFLVRIPVAKLRQIDALRER